MWWQNDENQPEQPPRPQARPPDRLRWQPYFPPEKQPKEQRVQPRQGHRVNWLPGVVVLLLIGAGLLIGWRYLPQIQQFMSSMTHVGSGYPPEERLAGFLAVGFIGVVIVAVVRILVDGRRN